MSNPLEIKHLEGEVSCLSHLLPYDTHVKVGARLKDGLKEYLLLLIAAEEAIYSLQRDDLKSFDPLVGENACQIRAIKLATLLMENSFEGSRLLEGVLRSKQIVKDLLSSDLKKETISLRDMIVREGISVWINDSEKYLIKSFLLSMVKTVRMAKPEMPLVKNEYTDTKKIKEMAPVGTMFAENLVKNLKRNISGSSVQFVQELASKLSSSESSVEMTSDKFLIEHRGLQCIPCYWMTKVLMQEAHSKRIPIVMLVEQVAKDRDYEVVQTMTLFFQATSGGYKEVSPDSIHPNMPALVLVGRSCGDFSELPTKDKLRTELLKHNPTDLVLAYAADHRQYPDMKKDCLVSSFKDESYRFHKTKSQEWGCSIENPSLFFLAHAYCDRIKNIELDV